MNQVQNYLTDKEDIQIDKDTSTRILEVSKFEETYRNHVFSVIDAFIAKRKIQSILYYKCQASQLGILLL